MWQGMCRKLSTAWLLLLLLLCPLQNGCWDRLEIEDRANVLAIAVDVASPAAQQEEPEVSHLRGRFPVPTQRLIRIAAQIAVPGRIPLGPSGSGGGGGGNSPQKPVWIVRAVGHTLDDAVTNLQQQLADRVFLSHLRVIVISEAYARQGVENVNEFLRRDPEVRRTAWLLVAKGQASKLIESSPELERVPALYLMATMDHAVAMGKFPNDFLGNFWSLASSRGQQPYLPYVERKANNTMEIAGISFFKMNKMVGIIKALEIGDYMALEGLNPGGYLAAVPVPGTSGLVMLHTTHRKSNIKVDLKNGRPHATVRIMYEAELEEKFSTKIPLNDSGLLRNIQTAAAQADAKAIKGMLQDTQSQGSDIFGFGERFRAKQATYWDSQVRTEEKWSEIYKTLAIDVSVSARIRRVGMSAQ